jgi:hypothetical protein
MSTHFHVSGTGVTGPLAGLRSHYKWWVLVTAIFGAFVSILDATVVNTALPHIQLDFGTDLHTASYLDFVQFSSVTNSVSKPSKSGTGD